MRSYSAAVLARLQARDGIAVRLYVLISGRNFETGAVETLGLWTGSDVTTAPLGGRTFTCYGAGGLIGVDAIVMEPGVGVRTRQISLSSLSPAAELAMRGYDTRLASVEVWRALLDPLTLRPIDPPHRLIKGVAYRLEMPRPAEGEEAACTLTVASGIALTRTLSARQSDEDQRRRQGDRFFRYADVSGSVQVYWGEARASAESAGVARRGSGSSTSRRSGSDR